MAIEIDISPTRIVLESAATAIAAIGRGELVVVVDDESRENEGDLVMAADMVTPDSINFMITHGRGLAALRLPLAIQALSALSVKRTVQQVLQHDPTHRDANYLLGRWHLAAPAVLGGSPPEAVKAFAKSVAASEEGDTRALVGLADAHLAVGDRPSAVTALEQAAIARTVSGSRAALRADRIRARLLDLDAAPLLPPQTGEKESVR